MGLLFSLPLAGVLGSVGTSCLAGLAFCFTSTAASMFCKSCNCNSSIATRVGFAIIFCINSMLAWLMRTDFAIKQIEKWSYDYIKMDCAGDKCYGVLAVHRICFALTLFHAILSLSLIGVKDTKDKRAAIQNGWWGPKVLLWLVLLVLSWFIPNQFFMFWGNYVTLIGATLFILLGLILLVDFAHSWSETCLDNWENASDGSNLWQWILIGSTALMSTTLCYIEPCARKFIVQSTQKRKHNRYRDPAATNSRALVGKRKNVGAVHLEGPDEFDGHAEMGVVNTQPSRTESPRYQALLAAVEAGAIPESALHEEEESDDEDEVVGDNRDDERSGTRYNYSWFHVIFVMAAMYVAALLTDANVVSKKPINGPTDPNSDVYIGQSEVAMWMRVVSSWICILLYMWSLLAPVLMPDRFSDV
ncbi:membrane protein [Lentinula edodes]|uniref:Membrane protein n=1 Tax=Lentinula edodes TaxID=5353 RepID=A0A1Q3EMK3_LENED|nr:membrane protein [Lentinula edodes]